MLTPVVTAERNGERGQTLPIWLFAVLTALTLMFFVLNYANVLRAQVRAQNAADTITQAMLGTQARRWNEMTVTLYALDVEEWRIRSLMQAMIDATNGNGGCKSTNMCSTIYQALQPQLYKAVNRYTADMFALQATSYYSGLNRLQIGAAWDPIVAVNTVACSRTPLKSTDCDLAYHLIDPPRDRLPASGTWPQVAKDALSVHVGGTFSATNVTPWPTWQPFQVEIAACATVAPIFPFSLFGATFTPKTAQVIGRAAAAMVPITTEWLAPGVTTNPHSGTAFQPTEIYTSADTFSGISSPRDWYETTFPAQPYTADVADKTFSLTNATLVPDFEVFAAWWGVIPIEPYITATQNTANLCTES
jgi:hypothetical protein